MLQYIEQEKYILEEELNNARGYLYYCVSKHSKCLEESYPSLSDDQGLKRTINGVIYKEMTKWIEYGKVKTDDYNIITNILEHDFKQLSRHNWTAADKNVPYTERKAIQKNMKEHQELLQLLTEIAHGRDPWLNPYEW